ncbi:MAG: glucuronate isomerase [Lawsonibacter sp.]|jgi:glucuronate isomerase|nr:glucuronate isomerase [Lawsonibacter sp.]
MREFMDKDFLLETATARHLYHDYAASMPLVDYHCHISPREIFEDRRFDNLVEVWLGGENPDGTYFGDHYKWRLMRSNGVPEDYVTGSKPAFERFLKFAETLEMAMGNPMYHWCNLELRQFFGYDKPLTPETAKECWDFCNEKLRHDPGLTVRGIIKKANVAMIGTTDDPVDSLEWHEKIAADPTITVKVCPSFRPDKAINISKPGFAEYIGMLAASVGKDSLDTVEDVCAALTQRLEFFARLGCRASDHGLDYIPFRPSSMEKANEAFRDAMTGKEIGAKEAERYQTAILLHLGREYHRLNIAMQLHYSCMRNMNERMYAKLGPDTGFDAISQNTCGQDIARLLSALDREGKCPKTILYSLNPADNQQLGTILGCFQSDEIPGKIQHGSAWWFNDTKSGMEEQMKSLANLGLLGNFVGMLTDSRSFLSYARHDYFRRILCNLMGNWVENGEYPSHEASLKRIVEGVSYRNAARYFGV